jgi:serine/threonine protein kinase
MISSGTSDSYDYISEYPEINKFKFQENEDFHVFDVNEFKEVKTLGYGRFFVKHYEYIPRENFPIAVKIIPIHKPRYNDQKEENRSKQLIREIENLKKVTSHPNIIKFYGICLHNEQAWICMELMDMTLHEFYSKTHQYYNNFSESILGCIVMKIIDALQYCKSKGIIHRDLKPQNILIKKTGEIKLCDFGESRVLEGGF